MANYSDNFNRSNSATIADGTHPWAAPAGTTIPALASNAASAAGERVAYWDVDVQADQEATFALGTEKGPAVRVSPTAKTGYRLWSEPDPELGSYYHLDRIVGGTVTGLRADWFDLPTADVGRLVISGSTLSVYVDGTFLYSHTDPSPITSGRVGLWFLSAGSGDNWSAVATPNESSTPGTGEFTAGEVVTGSSLEAAVTVFAEFTAGEISSASSLDERHPGSGEFVAGTVTLDSSLEQSALAQPPTPRYTDDFSSYAVGSPIGSPWAGWHGRVVPWARAGGAGASTTSAVGAYYNQAISRNQSCGFGYVNPAQIAQTSIGVRATVSDWGYSTGFSWDDEAGAWAPAIYKSGGGIPIATGTPFSFASGSMWLEVTSTSAASPARLRLYVNGVLVLEHWDNTNPIGGGYPAIGVASGSTARAVDDFAAAELAEPPQPGTGEFAAGTVTLDSNIGAPVPGAVEFPAGTVALDSDLGEPVAGSGGFLAGIITLDGATFETIVSRVKQTSVYPAFTAFGGLDSYTGKQKGQIASDGEKSIGYRVGLGNDGVKGDRVFLHVDAAQLLRANTPTDPVGKATLHVTFLSMMSWNYWASPAWEAGTFAVGQSRANGGRIYRCTTAGTSITGPTGTGTGIADGGTARWAYVNDGGSGNPTGTAFTVRRVLSGSGMDAVLDATDYGSIAARPIWLSGQTWYDGVTRGSPVWECEVDVTTAYNLSAQTGTDLDLCLECGFSDHQWVAEIVGVDPHVSWGRPRIEVHRWGAVGIELTDTDTPTPTITVTPPGAETFEIRWGYDEEVTPQGGAFKYAGEEWTREGYATASPLVFPMLESSSRVFVEVEVNHGAQGSLLYRRTFKTGQAPRPLLAARAELYAPASGPAVGTFGWLDVRGPVVAPPGGVSDAWYVLAKRNTPAWASGTVYPSGAQVVSGGYRWTTRTGGTSGATAPTVPNAVGVSDGGVTWYATRDGFAAPGTWRTGQSPGQGWELFRATTAEPVFRHHVGTWSNAAPDGTVGTDRADPFVSYFAEIADATYIWNGPDLHVEADDVGEPFYDPTTGAVHFLSSHLVGGQYEIRVNTLWHHTGGEPTWGITWPAGVEHAQSAAIYTTTGGAAPNLAQCGAMTRALDWRYSCHGDFRSPLLAAFVADGALKVLSVATFAQSEQFKTYSVPSGAWTTEHDGALANVQSVRFSHALTLGRVHRTILAAATSGTGLVLSRSDDALTFTDGGGFSRSAGSWATHSAAFSRAWVTEPFAHDSNGHIPDAETCLVALQAADGSVSFRRPDLTAASAAVALAPVQGADWYTAATWNRATRAVSRWPTAGLAAHCGNGGMLSLRSSGSTLYAQTTNDVMRVSDESTATLAAAITEIHAPREHLWEGMPTPVVTKHADGYRVTTITVGTDVGRLVMATPDLRARFSSGDLAAASFVKEQGNQRDPSEVTKLVGHDAFAIGWKFDTQADGSYVVNPDGMLNEAGYNYLCIDGCEGERIRLIVHDTPTFGGKWRAGTFCAAGELGLGYQPEFLGGVQWATVKFATWFWTNDPPTNPNREWHRVLDGMDYVLDGESGGGAYVITLRSPGEKLWLAHDLPWDVWSWKGAVAGFLAASSGQFVKWSNASGELLYGIGPNAEEPLSQVAVKP